MRVTITMDSARASHAQYVLAVRGEFSPAHIQVLHPVVHRGVLPEVLAEIHQEATSPRMNRTNQKNRTLKLKKTHHKRNRKQRRKLHHHKHLQSPPALCPPTHRSLHAHHHLLKLFSTIFSSSAPPSQTATQNATITSMENVFACAWNPTGDTDPDNDDPDNEDDNDGGDVPLKRVLVDRYGLGRARI